MKQTTPAQPGTTERPRFPFSLPGVLLIVALYALTHATTRLLASGNLGEDDTLDNLLIQTLAPGYSAHVGPLYDWALWLLQRVLGSGIQAFLLLKYSLLVSIAGLIFLITRRITGSPLWAFIAVESMATVYQIFWRFHEGFTHRVGAMALTVATVWAILRLLERGSWRNYLLFAVLAGLGLLSEHTYAFFLLALLLAASLQSGVRRQLFSWPLLAALPVTLLIISPYLLWLLADPQRTASLFADYYPLTPVHTLAGFWSSLRDATSFPFLVLSPYIVITPLVFPAIFKAIFRQTPLRPTPSQPHDFRLLLTHLLLILFGGLLVSGLLYSRANFPVHSILPLFVIAIVWITDRARATQPSARRIKVFMSVLLAFTATAYAVRCGNLFVYEPFCSRCRWGVPYNELAGELRGLGFKQGSLITNDERIGGNLRRYFPDTHISAPNDGLPPFSPPATGQLAIVWQLADDNAEIPANLQALATDSGVATPPIVIDTPWQHLWKAPGYRHSKWAAIIVGTPTRVPGKD